MGEHRPEGPRGLGCRWAQSLGTDALLRDARLRVEKVANPGRVCVFRRSDWVRGTALAQHGTCIHEDSLQPTDHPAGAGEADLNMLIQPPSASLPPKLQYASDLRILDFSLRKERNDLSGE